MLVPVEARPDQARAVPDPVEHEHPAAAHPERLAGPRVAIDRVHDPQAEDDQGEPDDPAHDRVEPVGQERPERERGQPEGDDDRAVAERVERAELDRLALSGQDPCASDARSGGAGLGESVAAPGPASWARTSRGPP